MSSAAELASLDIAGVRFIVKDLATSDLPGWTLLVASHLPSRVGEGYITKGFAELVAGFDARDDVVVLSRWGLLNGEFGWPVAAGTCGCLDRHSLADAALKLNGDVLFRTPGPMFDHFLIRAETIRVVLDGTETPDGVHQLSAEDWLRGVGLETSWFTLGHIDASPRSTRLRDALRRVDNPWLYDSYARALDVHLHGGVVQLAADELRKAFIDQQLADQGYTFAEPETPGMVVRRVFALNALLVTESVCCSTVERRGARMFMTDLEEIAQRSKPTRGPES